MKEWHELRQNERRKQFNEQYVRQMFDKIDADANWLGDGPQGNFREKMWHCLPLLDAGGAYAERANRIIESIATSVCHFTPMTSLQILFKYEDRLSRKSITKLENYIKEGLSAAARDRIHFSMYNDNFAAMAAFTLLTAGERFGDDSAFRAGLDKLHQLREVFTRRGTIMEYNSPTYTPITTHVLAETANYVRDAQARELARQCEERMWAEIAIRYHPPTAHLAGPYSRAYWVDSVGHLNNIGGLLYLVFGEAVFIHPLNSLFPPDKKQVQHIGAEALMLPNIAWLMSGNAHCPDYLAELLLNKSYPFSATATAECLPGCEFAYRDEAVEFPAWSGPVVTYMTEEYAMGTACAQFYDGAISDSFHIVYRKQAPATRQADTGAILSRYLFQDRLPEQTNVYNREPSGPEMFRDEGRKFALQHEDCALVVYRPKPYEAKQTTSMKLTLLIPCHYGEVDEIWLGDRKLEGHTGESKESTPVYIRDGSVYFCFKPLALTDHGRAAAVKVHREGHYLLLSFYNYEGGSRSFTTRDALLTTNGFIAHVKTAAEIPAFSDFRRYASEGHLEDKIRSQLDSSTRWIRYTRTDLSMHFAYSPVSEGVLISSVNGKPRPEARLQATGLDTRRLPFLHED